MGVHGGDPVGHGRCTACLDWVAAPGSTTGDRPELDRRPPGCLRHHPLRGRSWTPGHLSHVALDLHAAQTRTPSPSVEPAAQAVVSQDVQMKATHHVEDQ